MSGQLTVVVILWMVGKLKIVYLRILSCACFGLVCRMFLFDDDENTWCKWAILFFWSMIICIFGAVSVVMQLVL